MFRLVASDDPGFETETILLSTVICACDSAQIDQQTITVSVIHHK